MSALLKTASTGMSFEMLVFLRNFFSLLFLLPFLARLRLEGLKTKVLHLHLMRAAFGVTGIYLFVYAISHLPLAEGVLLNHTSALFVPFIAFLWLGERLTRWVGAALVIGFVGIALILKPGEDLRSFGTLVGLASGMTTAMAVVRIRKNAETEPYQRIVFYFFTLASLVSFVPAALAWQTPTPLGLLSNAPHALSLPVEILIRKLGLTATTARALSSHPTPEGALLKLTHACEINDVDTLSMYAQQLGIPLHQIYVSYLDALIAASALDAALH